MHWSILNSLVILNSLSKFVQIHIFLFLKVQFLQLSMCYACLFFIYSFIYFCTLCCYCVEISDPKSANSHRLYSLVSYRKNFCTFSTQRSQRSQRSLSAFLSIYPLVCMCLKRFVGYPSSHPAPPPNDTHTHTPVAVLRPLWHCSESQSSVLPFVCLWYYRLWCTVDIFVLGDPLMCPNPPAIFEQRQNKTLVPQEDPLKVKWTYILLTSLPKYKRRVKDFLPNIPPCPVPVRKGLERQRRECQEFTLTWHERRNQFLDFSQRHCVGLLLVNSCLHGGRRA